MSKTNSFTRRIFLTSTSCLGAALAAGKLFPLPALAESLAADSRVSEAPLIDRGFASVRKIGEGVYATVSDFSKGFETVSNGGFIAGKDAALIIEGHRVPAGAAFEHEALRMVSKVPVQAAIDTHYHFDHSMGNAFYGAQGFPIWAHARTGPLMVERYAQLQGQDKSQILDSFNKRLRDATSETERQHIQSDLNAYTIIFSTIDSTVVALPTLPLDPAKLPRSVDLGGIRAVIENYPGHTPTDIIIRVPEQNIVFTGDLLFNSWYPATFDADIAGWRATLEKFAAFGKDTLFVPGHGQVCGQEGVITLRAVFDHLYEHALKSYQAGLPVAEAQRRYTLPGPFSSFRVFSWGLCIEPAIAKYYEQFGKPKG